MFLPPFFWQDVGNWIMSWITSWSMKTQFHPRIPELPDEVWLKIILMLSKDFRRDKDIMKREIRSLKNHLRMLKRELRHRLKLQKSLYGFQKASQFFIPQSLFDAAFPYLIMVLILALALVPIVLLIITAKP